MTLYSFLLECKVDRGSEHTHTSFQRPMGSFYVPATRSDQFMALYTDAVVHGEDVYLTERHRHLSPVLVDLDFRFRPDADLDGESPDAPRRRYSPQHIESIVYVYGRAIKALIDITALLETGQHLDFYVMEKTSPSRDKTKELVKDGVHLMVPSVVTRASVQYILRRACLPGVKEALSDLSDLSNSVDDIVDESIIERNNWLMYGSKKPGGEAYRVTRVLRFDPVTEEVVAVAAPAGNPQDVTALIDLLSIRNKYEETPVLSQSKSDIDAQQEEMDNRQRRRDAQKLVMSGTVNSRPNVCESLEAVYKLVEILSAERAESYTTWIRLGWCLRNIDHRLLDRWVAFSKRSTKYMDGECERLWDYMRPGGLGLGTLHMWAKQDNEEQYKQLVRRDLTELILRCTSGTHHDVARAIYHMYKYDYVCASIRNKCWYEFREHRWRQSDCAYTLRKKISIEVVREFLGVAMQYNQMSLMIGTSETDAERYSDVAQKLNTLCLKLKTTTFKENVMKECCEFFYHEKFEEKLDSFCHLIGFENGVYDLDALEFREGRPDDFISFSTGISYAPLDPEDANLAQIHDFLQKVLPNRNVRNYVLRTLAGALNGHIREERFHVWTGSGSNGKSKTIELFEKAFGDYCCKFPVTLLTQKRAASNAATSEIARAKGKRFAVLQEPSEDEKLNIGLMKELTGGDKIMTRKLYAEPQEWKPQWTLALLCNHLPNVPSDDGGTWRRIRVVEFNSRFVETPNPEKGNEFPMDQELSKKFDAWREPFMAMLIDLYRAHVNRRLAEPEEVTACTREYQKNNDHMADFIDTCLQKVPDQTIFVNINDVFQEFKDWLKEDNIPIRLPKKKDVQNYLDKNLQKGVHSSGRIVYKGIMIRDRSGGAEDATAIDALEMF
jgi:P4 family phage/plasmid primase-like protien